MSTTRHVIPGRCYTLLDAQKTNPVVHRILRSGGTLEDVVCSLANINDLLTNRILELDSIAPFKIRLQDGRVLMWSCPEELVPLKGRNNE